MKFFVFAAAVFVAQQAAAACPPPPPPIVEVPGVAYYTDPTRSMRDDKMFRLNREAQKAVEDYLSRVARLSDAHLRGDAESGQCAARWIASWARGDALLGEPTSGAQARSQRRWTAAGMAMVALKVWEAVPKDDRPSVRDYFSRLAAAVQRDAETDRLRNNLLYWAGLVYAASAPVVGDPALAERAVAICRDAVAGFTPQGSLPLEDRRAERAIDYNGFALFPLSAIAAINQGRRPGCATDDLRPLALHVLANRDRTADQFLRWVPFMGMPVPLRPEVLFYSYGGGALPLLAERMPGLVRRAEAQ